jgi:hypothetical protein
VTRRYCRIVKVEKVSVSWSSAPAYDLTHECGRVERRYGKRITRAKYADPPVRVACDNAGPKENQP